MSPSSPDLVAAAVEGDRAARERLVAVWLPVVMGWCMRMGGPRVDADDAAADVFIVVLRNLDKVLQPDRFPSWLFGVTRRTLAAHRRRAWVRRWVPGAEPVAVETGPDPLRCAEMSQAARQVQQVFERLPVGQREVLVLCDLEERSSSEVSVLLDLPQGTIKSRLRLGRARFRKEARRLGIHPPEGTA